MFVDFFYCCFECGGLYWVVELYCRVLVWFVENGYLYEVVDYVLVVGDFVCVVDFVEQDEMNLLEQLKMIIFLVIVQKLLMLMVVLWVWF